MTQQLRLTDECLGEDNAVCEPNDKWVEAPNPWGTGTILARATSRIAAEIRQGSLLRRRLPHVKHPSVDATESDFDIAIAGRIDGNVSSYGVFWTAVSKALGCSAVELDATDLAQRTCLDLSGQPITDINSIKHFRSLKDLNLSKTLVNDLVPLSYLSELNRLYLSDTPLLGIADLEPLKSLKHLTWVEICGIEADDEEWVEFGRDIICMPKTEFVRGQFLT